MNSDCATRMQHALCIEVGGMSKFDTPERADVALLSVNPDPRLPFVANAANAKQPAFVVASRKAQVLHVYAACRFAQVGNSVVILDAIDVIEVASWPNAMHVEPRQPVGPVQSAVDLDHQITSGFASRNASGLSLATANQPRKNTGNQAVKQKRMQSFCRQSKIVFAHVASFIDVVLGSGAYGLDTVGVAPL